MYHRRLPEFPDLRSFLAHLYACGDLRRIAAPVSMRLEVTELHRRDHCGGRTRPQA